MIMLSVMFAHVILHRPVTFLTDCVGPEVEAACANPAPGNHGNVCMYYEAA